MTLAIANPYAALVNRSHDARAKICVFGTHHAYQYQTPRRAFFSNIQSLIQIHSVDLIAEEASGIHVTYAQAIASETKIAWKNVDLTFEERKYVPDLNPLGIGTQVDLELQILREWIWVIRTLKATKESALLICGFAHMTGLAAKFLRIGCDVETHVYFDGRDEKLFMGRVE